MSGKSKQVRDNIVKDFAAWWNHRHFHSPVALHAVFKKMHTLGANVEYIDFLRMGVLFRDGIRIQSNRPAVDPRVRKRDRRFGAFIREFQAELGMQLLLFVWTAVELSIGEISKRYFLERDPESLLSNQDVRKLVSETFLRCAREMADEIVKEPERWMPAKRGNKPDPSGTVFLLEVTEHLRETTGKPHSLEARRLLRAVRGESRRSSRTDGQSALVRVNNWKKANPNWKDHVDEMTLFFASLGTSKS